MPTDAIIGWGEPMIFHHEYSKIQKSDLRAFIYENIEDYDENILVENGDINDTDLNTHPFNLQNTKADKELKKYLHDNFTTPDDEDL